MQRLPRWTGLGYSEHLKLGLIDSEYEKVQIADEIQEAKEKKHVETRELPPGKTVWDWLQLLIIPIVLAGVVVAFNVGQWLVNQQLAQQSRQEQMVDAYIDRMSNLLVQYNLNDSPPGAPIRATAQAITLTTLGRLDSEHKNIVLLFLYRADILKYHYYKYPNETECGDPKILKKQFPDEKPIITLAWGHVEGVTIKDADLSCIDLHNAYLEGSNFSTSVLDRADLGLSKAMNADFSYTSLFAANLFYMDFSSTNLQGAILRNADMLGICLSHARLNNADLYQANLGLYRHSVNPATFFCGQSDDATSTPANLSDAVLTGAILTDAILTQANLTGADLSGADLSGANLSGVNLDNTTLKGARYNTKEIQVKNSQGHILTKIPPTTWPQGFNPKAVGAVENNTLRGAYLHSAYLHGAYLYHADLSGANLRSANLSSANLSDANLNRASLWGADLSGADLRGAQITQAQLNEANSLKGTTMPDGSTHP